jgi:hypothetical protein
VNNFNKGLYSDIQKSHFLYLRCHSVYGHCCLVGPKIISWVRFSLQELVEMVKAKKAAQAAVAPNIQKSK